jgi:hypothetical protein
VDRWSHHVTHVVCRVDEQGAAKRTMRYLQGCAAGAWVVGAAWLQVGADADPLQ